MQTRPRLASSAIVERDGRFLLVRRRNPPAADLFAFPGGRAEPGETPEETAVRELFEETGLIADELALLDAFSGPETNFTYPNGDAVFFVDVVYLCRRYHGTLAAQPDEVTELRFFPADALPENLSPPIAKPLLKYVARKLEG